MVLVTPQITDNFIAYLGDVKSTSLSLLISIFDDFSGKESIGNINVMIEEGNNRTNKNIRAIKNPSGYYFFNDLPDGNYTVSIASEYYFPEKKTVDTGLNHNFNEKGSLKYNILEILLIPRPSYPFPDNATLVRGLVSNTSPLTDCSINVVDENITTKTDERGEFVLFFKRLEENGEEKQKIINIKIMKGKSTKTINTTIKEGKTTYLGIISFP